MFFGILTIFMSSFIFKKCDAYAHATVHHYEQREHVLTRCFLATKRDTTKSYNVCMGLGTYCDPFGIPYQHWVDDVSKWPPVDYPSIYTYFIETPGGYTRERLKVYKSREACNYYQRLIFTQMISTST